MSPAEPSRSRKKYRAPEADCTALIDPPIEQHASLVEQNRALAEQWDVVSGVPFSRWRAYARFQLRAVAAGSRSLPLKGTEPPGQPSPPIILAGHQPTLFHPGVWLKNFLLSSVAKHVGGNGINLVIDADICRRCSIDVPTRRRDSYGLEDVAYDVVKEFLPWENSYANEPRLYEGFSDRVRHIFAGVTSANEDLLLDRLWPLAIDASNQERAKDRAVLEKYDLAPGRNLEAVTRRSFNPSRCIVSARASLESQLGLSKGEVALSDPRFIFPFRDFVEALLTRHSELCTAYNEALLKFRLLNGYHNPSHPVPELQQIDDWYEVPFWILSYGRRKRAFARRHFGTWQLTDREGVTISPAGSEKSKSFVPWEPMPEMYDVKVRPRALITTMYARLILSDLFIHGIGGAKYDEVTDEIIRRFFGIEPPKYVTAAATFRLPIERLHVTIKDVRQAAEALRNVRFRPEMLLKHPMVAADPGLARELQSLADEKRDYVRSHALRRCSRDVYQGLDRINRAMHDRLRELESQLRSEHSRLIELARQSELLGSREFSFVLFPEKFLVPQLLALSEVPA